ncbi:unnamed protein product, partial [Ectocarpus sp. 12 AP-2014]
MSQNAITPMGAMATPFLTPDSSMGFDARTMNTQHALNAAIAMGGGTLPPGMGMMAGILPAALKIQEHKDMQKVAERYYEKYIKDFNRKYGFTPDQINELVTEFNDVTDEIKRLIPDEKMRDMYAKYIESYPTMYLSMIPAEALQTKLAVKCVSDNKALRQKIETMSTAVSSLVRNLTDLQISAGIPPIVNLMFESMPDPLTAMTDPMYQKYNDAIVTYHKLLQDAQTLTFNGTAGFTRIDPTAAAASSNAEFLRLEPVQYLDQLATLLGTYGPHEIKDASGITLLDKDNEPLTVTPEAVKDLATVLKNMQTQSGCQPFGEEWNHTGPTPPMNPAMCLGEENRFQPGNP